MPIANLWLIWCAWVSVHGYLLDLASTREKRGQILEPMAQLEAFKWTPRNKTSLPVEQKCILVFVDWSMELGS